MKKQVVITRVKTRHMQFNELVQETFELEGTPPYVSTFVKDEKAPTRRHLVKSLNR